MPKYYLLFLVNEVIIRSWKSYHWLNKPVLVCSSQQVMELLYLEGYTLSCLDRSNALNLCPSETSPAPLFKGKASLFCCFFFYILVYVSLATGAVCRCTCWHFNCRHPMHQAVWILSLCSMHRPLSLFFIVFATTRFFLTFPLRIQGVFSPWTLKTTRLFLQNLKNQ